MDHQLYRKLIYIIESYPRKDRVAFMALIRLMNRSMTADEQVYWLIRGKFSDKKQTKKYSLKEV